MCNVLVDFKAVRLLREENVRRSGIRRSDCGRGQLRMNDINHRKLVGNVRKGSDRQSDELGAD